MTGEGPAARFGASTKRGFARTLLLAAALFGAAQGASAQSERAEDFPRKPIRIIVPFAAGGGNDIFARLVGAKLGEYTGHSPIIENRPAAGGRVAAEYVANQPGDGYTLYIGASGNMSVAAAAYPDLAYHPTRSFTPLTMIADFPLILIVPPRSSAASVADLVKFAGANKEKATYGTTSPAFTLTTELLKLKTGMPGVPLPLKGSGEMVQCVNQDLCLLAIVDPPPAVPQIKEGRVRALAVTGDVRLAELPDVPSMKELGYPEVNTRLWSGVFAPASTPPELARKLEALLQRAVRDETVSARIRALAANPTAMGSAEFRAVIEKDIANYAAVVKSANLR
ncbi:MAG TPA: tripartite tricarboxylate transporter substrate binding protein, partial [Beijerinckiaceae bacterium]